VAICSRRRIIRDRMRRALVVTLLVAIACVVIVSAAASTLGVAPADAAAGGTGRVEGRITVDGKPLAQTLLTLSANTPEAAAQTMTDGDGRFVFKSVEPGRYELTMGLSLASPPQASRQPRCKASGYKRGLSVQTSQGSFVVSLKSEKKFRVKAGQRLKRDIETDCKPNAVIVPVTLNLGGA
jgi:carboxypeptidase family protein